MNLVKALNDIGAVESNSSSDSSSFDAFLALTALSSAARALAAKVVPDVILARLAVDEEVAGLYVAAMVVSASCEYEGF